MHLSLQNPPNVVVQEEQTGKGKGGPGCGRFQNLCMVPDARNWPSQEATLYPPTPAHAGSLVPGNPAPQLAQGEKSKARWLTLAPFWAGGSTLPSGLNTMPGSPFSP